MQRPGDAVVAFVLQLLRQAADRLLDVVILVQAIVTVQTWKSEDNDCEVRRGKCLRFSRSDWPSYTYRTG